MRILLVHNLYRDRGGEETYLSRIHTLLQEDGHEVLLFTKDSRDLYTMPLSQRVMLPLRMFHSFRTFSEVEKIVQKFRPDICHVNNIYPLISPSVFKVMKWYNIPIVMTVHNYRLLCPEGRFVCHGNICERCAYGSFIYCLLYNCRRDLLQSTIYAIVLGLHRRNRVFERYVALFITPSAFLREKLKMYGFARNRIEVLPHPIQINRDEDRQVLGNYVLYLGRLSSEKGLDTLLSAASQCQEIPFVLIGDGPARSALQIRCLNEKITNVSSKGFKTGIELNRYIQDARLLVLPSEWCEIFLLSIIDGFSHSKPVIASSIGAIPEIIEHGKDGLLFPPGDVKTLVAHIKQIWSNPSLAMSMGKTGYNKVLERYNASIYCRRLLTLYEETIARARGR
jgi:glycosyltransferase involved in cell wall biosynthesis